MSSKKHNKAEKDKDLDEFVDSLVQAIEHLKSIWEHIGFNKDTQRERLVIFYQKMTDAHQGITESEESLEETIEENINSHRESLRTMCHELCLKYDEHYASGETMLDEEKKLRERVKELQIEKNRRLEEYKSLSTKENDLCSILKEKKIDIKSKVPTESEMHNLKAHVKELEKLKIERVKRMEKFRDEIIELYHEVDVSCFDDSFTEAVICGSVDDLPLSENDLQSASNLLDKLRKKDEKLTDKIKATRAKIKQLWAMLNVENENLNALVNAETNVVDGEELRKGRIIDILTMELERCLELKMQNMQRFIESIRIEIDTYYAKLYYSHSQINEFSMYAKATDYTEELLKIHEDKLEDLKFQYTEAQTLYEKLTKWLSLWDQFISFEEKSKDPNRFKTRGYNAVEEEKTRKTFNNQLPKLQEDIRVNAEEYKETNCGKEFHIYGYYWLDYMQSLRDDYETFKKNEKNEKKILRDKNVGGATTSKLATPSMLRQKTTIKRKNDATAALNTPSVQVARSSKLRRMEDDTLTDVTTKPAAPATNAAKLKTTRKSKTPLRSKRRSVRAVGGIPRTIVQSTQYNRPGARAKAAASAANTTARYQAPKGLNATPSMSSYSSSTTAQDSTILSTKSSMTSSYSNNQNNTTAVSTKGYPFQNVNINEINYTEFTRNLQQPAGKKLPFELNGSKLPVSNATSAAASATTAAAMSSKRDALRSHKENDVKNKLTSTILHE